MWTPLFRGPDWMPITPKWGSFLHAGSHLKALRRLIGIAEQLIEMAPPAAEDVAPVELAHAHITGAKNA